MELHEYHDTTEYEELGVKVRRISHVSERGNLAEVGIVFGTRTGFFYTGVIGKGHGFACFFDSFLHQVSPCILYLPSCKAGRNCRRRFGH